MIKKFSSDEHAILVFAFRYALTRSSTAPSVVIRYINDNIEKCDTYLLECISKEISEGEELKENIYYKDWLLFQETLLNEIKKRENL